MQTEKEKLKTVKNRVAELLRLDEHLRNDDTALVLGYWRKVDEFDVRPPNKPVTSPATIIRARQKLQARGYFPPTDPDICRIRRKREVTMRRWVRT